jgi:DNA end-binding protein Ku
MPRSIWNGTITFGLIAVPIKVHSATEDRSVHFHQVHAEDGARIKQKRICAKEGKEVPYKEVVKGYEWGSGKYVVLTQEEIDAAAGERSRLIALEEFVCHGEIDPVYFDRTYYLGAGDGGEDAYRLLHDALERQARAGVGRWVFHNREYLVAIRSLDDVLALHTMRFADELVSSDDLDVPAPSRAPTKREVEMAAQLVDSLHDEFDPGAFSDTHRKRLLALIKRKAEGEEIDLTPAEQPESSGDLLSALEESLGGSKSGRSKQSGAGDGQRRRKANSKAKSTAKPKTQSRSKSKSKSGS